VVVLLAKDEVADLVYIFPRARRTERRGSNREDTHVKTQLAKMLDMIIDAVTKTVVALLPHLLGAYTEWVDVGKSGPSPLTSLTESSSLNILDLVQKKA
jgi:hypothetical protein